MPNTRLIQDLKHTRMMLNKARQELRAIDMEVTCEPCPVCAEHIPMGMGVIRAWHRLHYWCAIGEGRRVESETRLASGATV